MSDLEFLLNILNIVNSAHIRQGLSSDADEAAPIVMTIRFDDNAEVTREGSLHIRRVLSSDSWNEAILVKR